LANPTVIDNAPAFDIFTLDGDTSPGKSEIVSGGVAKEKIEDQQQLLTRGANTVVRGTVNAVTTYKLTLFTKEQLQKWQTWEAMFLLGRQRFPHPRVYLLQDLRYSWVSRVIFEEMSPQGVDKPGGPWTRQLVLHQWNRVAPYGGPIRVQSVDKEITAQAAATDAARQRLAEARAAAEAARRAGR
jgi:hypothetical protein